MSDRLTVKAIDAARPAKRTRKLFDGKGLYLEVTPTGAKWWRLKYRFGGKEKRISLGVYPETSLKVARQRRDDARALLANNVDPSAQRQAARVAGDDTFETVAREWHAKHMINKDQRHSVRVLQRLENNAFRALGGRRVDELTAPEVLRVLRRIEDRGAHATAHRVLRIIGQVCRYAIATGRATADPTSALRGALAPAPEKHFGAITDPKELGALLRAIDSYRGQPSTMYALRLAPLVFVRPGNLQHLEWSEVDEKAKTWTIPAAKLKGATQDHIVPLAKQALAILDEARSCSGTSVYAFPSVRTTTRPISDNTLNAALRRLGYAQGDVVAHGFRATARTMLDEVLHYRPDFIEHQLAHAVRDPNGRAYNRTAFLVERRDMMQKWADYLDGLRADAGKVVPLRRAHT